MVGAAATLAGVTRTTVSLAVIMFELTGAFLNAYTLIFDASRADKSMSI
jgi:H+/Cl- antiporter ClcA